MAVDTHTSDLVRDLLAWARIEPSEDELAAVAEGYAAARARVAGLYAVECGDGEPVLDVTFRDG